MTFEPLWSSPPGDTIADLLRVRNLSLEQFRRKTSLDEETVGGLFSGSVRIDASIANVLQDFFGSPASFWIRRQSVYDEDVARLKPAPPEELQDWAKNVPLNELVKLGWITPGLHRTETARAALAFFGVPNTHCFALKYSDVLSSTYFRTSPAFSDVPAATCAWLRRGQIAGENADCAPFHKDEFVDTLNSIRALTRVKEPIRFLPELTRLCARAGVVVVIARAPKGCRASGAAFRLSEKKCVIQLSCRYLTDDQFWFSFFHEAAHLILHRERRLFLEGIPEEHLQEENEANEFAASILVPPVARAEMMSLPKDLKVILKFAKQIGVSAGIVLGQLQHAGRIPHGHFSRLKTRYKWTA